MQESTLALFPSLSVYLHSSVDWHTLALFLSSVDRKHSRRISLSVCLPSFVCWSKALSPYFPICMSTFTRLLIDIVSPSFSRLLIESTLALFPYLSVYLHSSVDRKHSRPISVTVCLPSLVCWLTYSRPLSLVCWSKALSPYFRLCLPSLVCWLTYSRLLSLVCWSKALSPYFRLCLSTFTRLLIGKLSPYFPVCLSPYFPLCQSTFIRLLVERLSPSFPICLSTFTRMFNQTSVSLPTSSLLSLEPKMSHSSPLSVFTCLTNQETIYRPSSLICTCPLNQKALTVHLFVSVVR